MANVLSTDKKIAIIGALTEGSSIRAIERVKAWMHDTGDPDKPDKHVTALHVPPVESRLTAVQAFILEEIRNAQTA